MARAFALLTILCSLTATVVADDRPNVVLIVVDDFGWADLGCYESKFHSTPHMDRLASDGVRFTDAYSACPVCSPTRAAILTGKHPARLHLTDWLPGRRDMPTQKLLRPDFRQQLPLEEVTLAEHLTKAGYTCANIGKWHLGGPGFEPLRQGFAVNIAGDITGTPISYFAPFRNGARIMPGLDQAAEGEYLTDRLTSECESFMEQNRDRPFFVYLPHFTVHTPLKAKKELIEKYQKQLGRDWVPSGQQNNPVYAAMIQSLDESVGRILSKLDQLNLAERTIVVLTSDNGGLATLEGPNTPSTSNAPLREGKGFLYEGGIRVPLLIKRPGTTLPGSIHHTPVSSVDILPTLLDMCAVKHDLADGQSLVPLLSGKGTLTQRPLFWHYPHYSNQGGRPGGAIRSGEYKLIEFYENGRRELFDLSKDVRESTNLSDQKPDVVERLATQLADWRKSVEAQMPLPNPDYLPNPQEANGTITLHARTANVHGVMVRFEPQPHKNTLGFWTRSDDWVTWEFHVNTTGEFTLAILQGCGDGSGGAEVEFTVMGQTLAATVIETGGFQSFVERDLGTIKLDRTGLHTLIVKPKSKPGVAVMDLRQVVLKPSRKGA